MYRKPMPRTYGDLRLLIMLISCRRVNLSANSLYSTQKEVDMTPPLPTPRTPPHMPVRPTTCGKRGQFTKRRFCEKSYLSRATLPRLEVLHLVVDLVEQLTVQRHLTELSLIVRRLLYVRQHQTVKIHRHRIAIDWQHVVRFRAVLHVLLIALHRAAVVQFKRSP